MGCTMTDLFQVNIKNNVLLAMFLGLAASFSQNPSSQPNANFTKSLGTSKFLQPIIIPNITLFSNNPKVNETQKIKVGSQDYFIKKIFYPDEAVSQESKLDEKFSKEENKANDNSIRFSSRYSLASEVPDDSEEQNESSEESDEENDSRGESVEKATPDSSEESFESDKIQPKHDVIPERDLYRGDYLEPPNSTNSYFESAEEEISNNRPYSNVRESTEAEEEISSTTNEPYTELRSPTSFKNSQYQDEEFENYETSSPSVEEKDDSSEEVGKENKISPDDFHDSTSKNYHSVQTPLSEIRFRGPHSLKADFDKSRTRIIPPIKRHPITHNWPYSRAGLKSEENQSNEISESDESDSEEWQSDINKASTTSKLLDLERAVGVDESGLRENLNNKLNTIAGSSRQEDKHKSLRVAEVKDQQHPIYESIKHYRVDEEEEPTPTPSFGYHSVSKSKTNAWPSRPSITPQAHTQLFSRTESANIKPTSFNITKELTPSFQSHQFLGPIVFNQDTEEYRPTTSVKTTSASYTFSKDIEKKEQLDHQKQRNQKVHNLIQATTRKQMPSNSFDHQEESDEMYNQILANIQSVFGLRTQPLKSAGGRKSNQELNFEENRAFTWAVPLRKREKHVDFVGSEAQVRSGSDFVKSNFKSDILKPY